MTKILIDEAVAQFALWRLEDIKDYMGRRWDEDDEQNLVALRQALADAALDKKADNARELGLSYEQPAPAQEPVAYCNNTAIYRLRDEPGDWMLIYGRPQHPHTVPLYSRPQARDSLRTEEITEGCRLLGVGAFRTLSAAFEAGVRFTEAAHGITSGKTTEKGGAA